jgi:ATP-dependent RNA helicase DeaD
MTDNDGDAATTAPAPSFPAHLHPGLLAALQQRGFAEPTPVQRAVVDEAHGQRDLLVSSQTGSGKTVAFGLAAARVLVDALGARPRLRAERGERPRILVVAPTRELALQVQRELAWLYAALGARVASCVGGVDPRKERGALDAGVHVVVGTPGRLVDHLTRGSLDLTGIRCVVLDEADEMLKMGFREELEAILQACPPSTPGAAPTDAAPTDAATTDAAATDAAATESNGTTNADATTPERAKKADDAGAPKAPTGRRTLLFSATLPPEIVSLARTYQRGAVRITATHTSAHQDIDVKVHLVDAEEREAAVVNVLRFYEPARALVFVALRETVTRLAARLAERGFAAVALSGELSQAERTRALSSLREGRARVLVCTDVAARGLDLPDVGLVVHADVANDPVSMTHRNGRTGRAGRKGLAVILAVPFRQRTAELQLLSIGARVRWTPLPSDDDVRAADRARLVARVADDVPLVEDDERAIGAELVAAWGADAVAALLVRTLRQALPQPEEVERSLRLQPQTRGQRSGPPRFGRRDDRGPPPRRDDRGPPPARDTPSDDRGPPPRREEHRDDRGPPRPRDERSDDRGPPRPRDDRPNHDGPPPRRDERPDTGAEARPGDRGPPRRRDESRDDRVPPRRRDDRADDRGPPPRRDERRDERGPPPRREDQREPHRPPPRRPDPREERGPPHRDRARGEDSPPRPTPRTKRPPDGAPAGRRPAPAGQGPRDGDGGRRPPRAPRRDR